MEATGLDVGGLRLKAVRMRGGPEPEVLERSVIDISNEDRTPQGMLARMVAAARALGAGESTRVGLAMAGGIRHPGGVITQAPQFPALAGFPVKEALSAALGREVVVDNDANLHAYGEWRAGAARGVESLLGVFLGAGLGGALILDGKLHRGSRGLAGEIGHVLLEPGGEPCGCGARGCLEQYASSRFLEREARRRRLRAVEGVASAEVGRALAEAARRGDEAACDLYRRLGRNLGAGVAGILNVLDPDALLVGGGVALAWDLFGAETEAALHERLYDAIAADLRILRASLGEFAAAIGAACLALRR